MNAYEKFEDRVKGSTIREAMELPCPKCGGRLSYAYDPVETYMPDDTFVRAEVLRCQECNFEVEVEQVYKPVKCYVTSFDDTFCEDEEE